MRQTREASSSKGDLSAHQRRPLGENRRKLSELAIWLVVGAIGWAAVPVFGFAVFVAVSTIGIAWVDRK